MKTHLYTIGPVAVLSAPTLDTPAADWVLVGYSRGDASIRPGSAKAYGRIDQFGSTRIAGRTFLTGHAGQVEMRIAPPTLRRLASVVTGYRVSGENATHALGLSSRPGRVEERAWAVVPLAEVPGGEIAVNADGSLADASWIGSESTVVLPLACADVATFAEKELPGAQNQNGHALTLMSTTGGAAPMLVGAPWAAGLKAFGIRAYVGVGKEGVLTPLQTGASFLRASTATYHDPTTGNLVVAANDTPRIVKAADGRLGLLIEDQRTNYTRSDMPGATASAVGTSSVARIAETLHGVNETAVVRWIQGPTADVFGIPILDAQTLPALAVTTLSFWYHSTKKEVAKATILAKKSGSPDKWLNASGDAWVDVAAETIPFVKASEYGDGDLNKWKRVQRTLPALPTGYDRITINVTRQTSDFTAKLTRMQIEVGNGMTSFIRNEVGGLVTRAADQLTLPFPDLIDDTFSVGIDFERIDSAASQADTSKGIIPFTTKEFYRAGHKHIRLNDYANKSSLVATQDTELTATVDAVLAAYQASRRVLFDVAPARWRTYVNGELRATAQPPPRNLLYGPMSGQELRFPYQGWAGNGFILKGFFLAEGTLDAPTSDQITGAAL